MAEAVFKYKIKEMGVEDHFGLIDSFGTGAWHTGEPPDHRSVSTCRKHGVPIEHYAQQIQPADFAKFDYVIGMDESNLANLKRMQPRNSKSRVCTFGEWRTDPKFEAMVSDPYYGHANGFEVNFQQLCHFSENFIQQEVRADN